MPKKWSRWVPIERPSKRTGPAVYRVRLYLGKKPASLSRFLNVDDKGMLCIGMTSNMEDRRSQFEQGVSGKPKHSEARLLYRLETSTNLTRCYPQREYQYSFKPVRTEARAKRLEQLLIKQYVKKHGEVPPLNSAIPDRYSEYGWSRQ